MKFLFHSKIYLQKKHYLTVFLIITELLFKILFLKYAILYLRVTEF